MKWLAKRERRKLRKTDMKMLFPAIMEMADYDVSEFQQAAVLHMMNCPEWCHHIEEWEHELPELAEALKAALLKSQEAFLAYTEAKYGSLLTRLADDD